MAAAGAPGLHESPTLWISPVIDWRITRGALTIANGLYNPCGPAPALREPHSMLQLFFTCSTGIWTRDVVCCAGYFPHDVQFAALL